MTKNPELTTDDDLELSLETLDQWETELDQFAAAVMKRLSQVSGKTIDVSGLIPQSASGSSDPSELPSDDDPEAMRLLNSVRELTR